MKINKLFPQGYCGGVKNALNIAYNTLKDDNCPKPVYLLGSIIHNKNVIDDLKKSGAILIEDKNISREILLDKIDSGTVILSAHGVSPNVYKKAEEKGLNIIDTTCPNVLIVQNKIKKYLNLNYKCLYIGAKGHPECEGILGISSSIILISSIEDMKKINKDEMIYVTNQTTLSIYETNELYDFIKNNYSNAIIDNKICNATTIRQEACLKQEHVDLCIVVGDKSSSNTKKLTLACIKNNIKTIQIENLEDLKKFNFNNINSISITSGASTPDYIVNEIIEYLKRVD